MQYLAITVNPTALGIEGLPPVAHGPFDDEDDAFAYLVKLGRAHILDGTNPETDGEMISLVESLSDEKIVHEAADISGEIWDVIPVHPAE